MPGVTRKRASLIVLAEDARAALRHHLIDEISEAMSGRATNEINATIAGALAAIKCSICDRDLLDGAEEGRLCDCNAGRFGKVRPWRIMRRSSLNRMW